MRAEQAAEAAAKEAQEKMEMERARLAELARRHEDSVLLASFTQKCFQRFLRPSVVLPAGVKVHEFACQCDHDTMPSVRCTTGNFPFFDRGLDGFYHDTEIWDRLRRGMKLVQDSVEISSDAIGCPLKVESDHGRVTATEARVDIVVRPQLE